MPPARTPSPPSGGADYPEESAPRIEEGRVDNLPGDYLGQTRRDSLVSETNTDTADSYVMDLAKDDTETPLRRRRNNSISGSLTSSTMSVLRKDNVWDRYDHVNTVSYRMILFEHLTPNHANQIHI